MASAGRRGRGRFLVGAAIAAALIPAPVASGASAQAPKKTSASRLAGPILRAAGQGGSMLGPAVRANGGKLQLAFRAAKPTGAAEESSLRALGATNIRSLAVPASLGLAPAGLVEAWVPQDKVEAASELLWVTSVGTPAYARFSPHAGTRNSSVLETAALNARGITGAGVKVGVVSDGVRALAAAQAAGELPAVTVVNQGTVGLGDGDEGTAMLEIIHDMAPGAQLFFHPAGVPPPAPNLPYDVTQVTLVNAFVALADAGVNVIVHDVGFFDEPIFQQGIVAAVSDNLGRAGISVHSAAGNDGITHAARVPAVGTGGGPDGRAGPFANCAIDPDNVVAIAPNGDTTFDIVVPPNEFQVFTLQWSEPRAVFPTPTGGGFTDLDFYIMDEGLTQCLGGSDLEQVDGTGDTFEVIAGASPFAVPTRVKLVVNVFDTSSAVAPPVIDLRWAGAAPVDTPTPRGSVDGVNNLTSGLAAATGAWFNQQVEPYSSRGPVELRLTTDCPAGTVKAADQPCPGAPGPPPQIVQSPAWVAPDRIPVSGAGGFPTTFAGTSAAAPVAAACDALVRQAIGAPSGQVASVFARLSAGAHDIAPPGIDLDSGAGLLSCTNAVSRANLTVQRAASTQVTRGATVDVSIDVVNQGPDAAPRYTVTDTLPAGVAVVSTPPECSASGQVVTCEFVALAPGATRRVTFAARVSPDAAAGSYTLNAALASAFDTNLADNAASLSITLTAPLAATGPTTLPQPVGLAAAAAGLACVVLLQRARAAP